MNKTISLYNQTTQTPISPWSQTTPPPPKYLLRPILKPRQSSRWQNRSQNHHYQHWIYAVYANIPRHVLFLQVSNLQKKPIVGRTIKFTLNPTLSYNYGDQIFSLGENSKILIEAKVTTVERLRPNRSAVTVLTTKIITPSIKLKMPDHIPDAAIERQLIQDLYIPRTNTKFQFVLAEDLQINHQPQGAVNKFIIPSTPPQVFPDFIDIPIPPLYR